MEKQIQLKAKPDVKYSGAKSIAWSILWIAFTVFIINLALFISTIVANDSWKDLEIEKQGTGIYIAPTWYLILQPIIGGLSLFLLSGTSILVFPLNKTVKKEKVRTFGTWFWGFFIWLFSVFYIIMFFFNLLAPILNLLIATKILDIGKLDKKAINICNTVMSCIPIITFISGGILYGRVKATYRKHHGQ